MKRKLILFLTLAVSIFTINCQPASKEEAKSETGKASSENKIEVVGNNWLVKFNPSAELSSANNVEYRLLKETGQASLAQDVAEDATTLELSNVDGYPPAGKIYTFNGETIAYSSISGNSLRGLERGREGSGTVRHSKGQVVYLVTQENKAPNKTEFQIPQLPDNYWMHYRWQEKTGENGNDGWSSWRMVGFAPGSANTTKP
jgi:hypothetical protein